METKEIFETVYEHQLEGIMFHNDLMQFFSFLSLDKLAHLQKEQFLDETKEMLRLQKFYMKTYDRLLVADNYKLQREPVVPQNWYQYTRFDVNTNDRVKSSKDGLMKWIEWEKKTKEVYQTAYDELVANKDMSSATYMLGCVNDVANELKDAKDLYLRMASVNFDVTVLQKG